MTAPAHPLVVTPVTGMPEVTGFEVTAADAEVVHAADAADAADTPSPMPAGLVGLAGMVADALRASGIELRDGDVLVLSSKVVSKALGLRAPADDKAAVVLGQSRRVVAERRTADSVTRIVEAVAGPVMAAAGVDASNTGGADLLLLPDDPDACARALLSELSELSELSAVGRSATGRTLPRIGLVLSDTAGRPWRAGQVDFALGAAGLPVLDDLRGATDADGRTLSVTVRCLADELAAAADLVKGKDRHVALAHVRGLAPTDPTRPETRGEWLWGLREKSNPNPTIISHEGEAGSDETGARGLVRTGPTDWFALGHYEAVRASLGVAAGSPEAERIGIPSVAPEDPTVRTRRAVALALLGLDGVDHRAEDHRIVLQCADPVTLGRALGRLPAALWAEGLAAMIDHQPGSDHAVATIGERD